MIDALAFAITLLCLGTGAMVTVQAGRGTFRRVRIGPTLGLVELALIVQAVLDVIGLARGHTPRELTTHLAYLVVSVALIPVALAQTRHDDGRWSAALLAVVLLVVAVLVVRLMATWRTTHG